ncbi:MAG: hypothetical protein KY463_11755 [Actinobacteria bacterium]|nr:hypothetical protein [Actinomycetota bacterium]
MLRPSIIIVALVAVLGLAACGGDDDTSSDTQTTTIAAAGDTERYCALTRRLDAEGEQFFAGLDEDSSPQEFEAAERRMAENFADEFDELQRAAPPQIKTDVRKLLAAIHKRAGLQPQIEISEAEAAAAEKRIQAFEKRHCKA